MNRFMVIFLLSAGLVFGEPSTEEIQNIQIGDIKKISGWMKDKTTKPRFKVLILEKLNILLLNNQEEILSHADELLEMLTYVKKSNKDDGSSYNYLLRKKSCLFLSYFNGSLKENESYEMIKSQILAENNGEVAGTCIRVIGLFENRKNDTNKFLVQILETSLKKKKISDDDIDTASAVIEVLDKFKKKQSYLTLLKVLDSKYPTDIKNQAKKTLETLPQ